MKLKRESGITLIALVITIIILLILAGITLNSILNDNGILSRSETARIRTEQAAILEELKLKAFDKQIDDLENKLLNIDYFTDAGYISKKFTQADETCYMVATENLDTVPKTGKGTEDTGDIYYILDGKLYYKSSNKEDELIGDVFIDPSNADSLVSNVKWLYEVTPEGDIEITGFELEKSESLYEGVTIDCPVLYIPSKIEGKTVKKVRFNNYPAHNPYNWNGWPKKIVVSGINKIIYPDTVEEIGGSRIVFPDVTEICLPANLVKIGSVAFRYPNIEKIELPETVKRIESSALSSCSNLKQMNLPENLEYLGSDVFSYCYSLESIIIPKNIIEIPSSSFSGCKSLKSVTILGNVTSIGDYTFNYCSSLKNIALPASVTSIGNSAFYNCFSLNIEYLGDKNNITFGNYAISHTLAYEADAFEEHSDGNGTYIEIAAPYVRDKEIEYNKTIPGVEYITLEFSEDTQLNLWYDDVIIYDKNSDIIYNSISSNNRNLSNKVITVPGDTVKFKFISGRYSSCDSSFKCYIK